jgi:hypothetical protein
MVTNNHIFRHLIWRGLIISLAGILLLLKLVAMPPATIKQGKTHGTLNRKK